MSISFKKVKIYTPFVFWAFQLIIHIIRNIYVLADRSFASLLAGIKLTFPLDFVTFSIFYFFFAPKFFKREKISLYIGLGIAYFILYSFIWSFVYYLDGTEKKYMAVIYASSMGHNILYAFYGIVIRMAIDWFEKRDEKRELEKQNVKIELALLRSQINPHFLFNTLNNINSFAASDPDKTSWSIIKLSDIMRYMLYEARAEKVLIGKEISYINNFLDLQRIRYKDSSFIQFRTGGIPSNIFIPPMLFIPFIENAFKHGKKSGNEKISISLEWNEPILEFTCTNRKRELSETEKTGPRGIGIENIRRRLELLYPGMHQLSIEETQTEYMVKLTIYLIQENSKV
jgi:two-component system, LytTR family, sensor kinase